MYTIEPTVLIYNVLLKRERVKFKSLRKIKNAIERNFPDVRVNATNEEIHEAYVESKGDFDLFLSLSSKGGVKRGPEWSDVKSMARVDGYNSSIEKSVLMFLSEIIDKIKK